MSFWILPVRHLGADQARRLAACIASWRRVCKVVEDRRSVCSSLDLSRCLSCTLLWSQFFPCAGRNWILFDDHGEELMHYSYWLSFHQFPWYLLLWLPCCPLISLFRESRWQPSVLVWWIQEWVSLAHRLQYHLQHGHKCSSVMLRCSVCLLFHRSCLNEDLCRVPRRHWQCLFSLLQSFPTCFWYVWWELSFFLSWCLRPFVILWILQE